MLIFFINHCSCQGHSFLELLWKFPFIHKDLTYRSLFQTDLPWHMFFELHLKYIHWEPLIFFWEHFILVWILYAISTICSKNINIRIKLLVKEKHVDSSLNDLYPGYWLPSHGNVCCFKVSVLSPLEWEHQTLSCFGFSAYFYITQMCSPLIMWSKSNHIAAFALAMLGIFLYSYPQLN
jgi:hypothetical protein